MITARSEQFLAQTGRRAPLRSTAAILRIAILLLAMLRIGILAGLIFLTLLIALRALALIRHVLILRIIFPIVLMLRHGIDLEDAGDAAGPDCLANNVPYPCMPMQAAACSLHDPTGNPYRNSRYDFVNSIDPLDGIGSASRTLDTLFIA